MSDIVAVIRSNYNIVIGLIVLVTLLVSLDTNSDVEKALRVLGDIRSMLDSEAKKG